MGDQKSFQRDTLRVDLPYGDFMQNLQCKSPAKETIVKLGKQNFNYGD